MPDISPAMSRYARHVILPVIGVEGQRRISHAQVLLVGLGALGSAIAMTMARAGVGHLRIVDADIPEAVNLHRQWLYDERDVADAVPKAVAAARKLVLANGEVTIEPVVARAEASNIEGLLEGCDLVLDGCDNVETRLLINDACLKHRVPWIYGAAVGTSGATMPIVPGDGPCFRCMVPVAPPPGSIPTGREKGILSTVPHLVASLQCTEALKLLCGRMGDLVRPLRCVDLWAGTMESVEITKGPARCPACDEGRWEFLEGAAPRGA